MNYKKVFKFYIFSIIFTIILGTILHFTFKWSGNNVFLATFSAVNGKYMGTFETCFFSYVNYNRD